MLIHNIGIDQLINTVPVPLIPLFFDVYCGYIVLRCFQGRQLIGLDFNSDFCANKAIGIYISTTLYLAHFISLYIQSYL